MFEISLHRSTTAIRCLLGVLFVALLGVLAPPAAAQRAASNPQAAGKQASTVLFSTFGGIDPGTPFGVVSQVFTDPGTTFFAAGADDFTITGNGWEIKEVSAKGAYSGGSGPAESFNVYILGNSGGLPDTGSLSAGAIYAAENISYHDDGSGEFTIPLPGGGLTLLAGTYWLVIQANMKDGVGGRWGWYESSSAFDSGTPVGFESAWLQTTSALIPPASGGAATCVDAWGSRVSTCDITIPADPTPPEFDLAFALYGEALAPGVTVTPTAITTNEAGATNFFEVVLTAPPTIGNSVDVPIGPVPAPEATASTAMLTFTIANWNIPQTVTITPVDDGIPEAAATYTVVNGPASSGDAGYSGLAVDDVDVTNHDDDSAGITVSPLAGLQVSEDGTLTATFDVNANTPPTDVVTVPLSVSVFDATVASPSVMLPSGSTAPVTVTVTGIDDVIDDGDTPFTVVTGDPTSAGDAIYDALVASDVADVRGTTLDDDVAGITITPAVPEPLPTDETGATSSFDVVLDAEPTADVTIRFFTTDAGEGLIDDGGTPGMAVTLTFTPGTWDTPQTITVTGQPDALFDGDIDYFIASEPAVSTDPAYDNLDPADVSARNANTNSPPDLSSSTKTVADTDDGQAQAGEVLTYTITVNNPSASGAVDVVITDAAPANTTFNAGSVMIVSNTGGGGATITTGNGGSDTSVQVDVDQISSGGAVAIRFTVTVDMIIPVPVTTITNTAKIEALGVPSFDTSPTTTIAVAAAPMITVTKTDAVLLDLVGDAGADPGDRLKYTVEITNSGPKDAAGVSFTDTVDPNTSLDCGSVSATPMATLTSCTPGLGGSLTIDVGTLAGSGGMITIMFEVEVVSPFPKEVFAVSNQGTTSGDNFADVQTDDPDTAAASDATTTEINDADVSITKTLTGTSGGDDGTVEATFLITVTNRGPNTATGVFVSDPLPEGTMLVSHSGGYDPDTGLWTIGELAGDASVSLTITLKTDDGDNNILNLAEVFANQPDRDCANNHSGSQARHDNPDPDRFRADLSLTKTVDNEAPAVGDLVTYTLGVKNAGPSTTAGVQVRERLPEGLAFVSATTSNAGSCQTCGYIDSLGVWVVGHVPVGTTVTLELVARVVGTGQIINTAIIFESHLPDPTADNDEGSAMVVVSSSKATSTVGEGGEGIPVEFELGGNYPNPFNPETRIPFGLPESGHVVLEVYNLLGRRVAVLLDESMSAGRHEVVWYALDAPSGVYVVRLVAGSVQKMQRVTLVK